MTTARDFCRYAPGLQRNAPLDRDTSPPFNRSRYIDPARVTPTVGPYHVTGVQPYICPACNEHGCDGPGDATCKARQP